MSKTIPAWNSVLYIPMRLISMSPTNAIPIILHSLTRKLSTSRNALPVRLCSRKMNPIIGTEWSLINTNSEASKQASSWSNRSTSFVLTLDRTQTVAHSQAWITPSALVVPWRHGSPTLTINLTNKDDTHSNWTHRMVWSWLAGSVKSCMQDIVSSSSGLVKCWCESNPLPRHLIRDLVRGDQTFQIWGSGTRWFVIWRSKIQIQHRLRLSVSSCLLVGDVFWDRVLGICARNDSVTSDLEVEKGTDRWGTRDCFSLPSAKPWKFWLPGFSRPFFNSRTSLQSMSTPRQIVFTK